MISGLPPGGSTWTGLETPTQARTPTKATEGGAASPDFGNALKDAVQGVEQHQANADQAIYQVASGQNTDLHGMMIALEEANISLRTMASVRDKVVEAYNTIWNMPV